MYLGGSDISFITWYSHFNLLDISLIEFIVYGLVGYTGAVLLVISAFRETPDGKAQSIVRAMYLTLSMISIMILAGSGVNITTETPPTTIIEIYNGTGDLVTNSTSYGAAPAAFVLLNPIWIIFHYMLAVVMLVYIILQILILFTKV